MLKHRLPLMFVLAALTAAAVAAPVSAGKPSNSVACSTPTLTGPVAPQVGGNYTIEGCGFPPGALVPLEISEADGCCMALNAVADSSGRFSYTSRVWAPGHYRARASTRHRSGNRWVVVAEWSFEAY